MESCVPPGFRFHPTEEELVGYYLNRKVNSIKFDVQVITHIDLYGMEPWDIQEKCKLGYDEQNEWYFFSHKDRKYPTGTRTNRATASGFWKATGRDKPILHNNIIIGMRKTLVFYNGRAPHGKKSDWIMHEYRLQTTHRAPPQRDPNVNYSQEEGWVVCRAFKKPSPSYNQGLNFYCMRNNNNNNNNIDSNIMIGSSNACQYPQQTTQCLSNFEQEFGSLIENDLIMELPRLESPSSLQSTGIMSNEENNTTSYSNNNKLEFLDNFMGSSSSSSSSFSNNKFNPPSFHLVPYDYDYEVEGQNTYLGYLPNL